MAYQKSFNPDALPAHAEPEQAAQMLAGLQGNNKPSSNPSSRPPSNTNPQSYPPPRRVSPAQPPNQGYSSPPPGQQYQHQSQYSSNPPIASNQPSYSFNSRLGSPPPPKNYGFGPPPQDPSQTLPTLSSRPPRTPQPSQPHNTDPSHQDLFPLFRAANTSATGTLSESELGSALVNGDFTSFDPSTVRMMMSMFAKEGNGTIGYEEFVSLWAFLGAWRQLFERFDEDSSGRINKEEFGKALVAFGYRLSNSFVDILFATFGKRVGGRGGRTGSIGQTTWNARGEEQAMSFDLFVRACVTLKRMTDVFKTYDEDRDGYVTLSFEEFLTEILKLRD